jgi:hypothetical protein
MTIEQCRGPAGYHSEAKPTKLGSSIAVSVGRKKHGHYLGPLKVILKQFLTPITRAKNEPHGQAVPSLDANPKGWEPCEWVDLDTLTEDLVRFGVVSD